MSVSYLIGSSHRKPCRDRFWLAAQVLQGRQRHFRNAKWLLFIHRNQFCIQCLSFKQGGWQFVVRQWFIPLPLSRISLEGPRKFCASFLALLTRKSQSYSSNILIVRFKIINLKVILLTMPCYRSPVGVSLWLEQWTHVVAGSWWQRPVLSACFPCNGDACHCDRGKGSSWFVTVPSDCASRHASDVTKFTVNKFSWKSYFPFLGYFFR